jgi:DNA-binding NtrC family response regulator
MKIMVVDDEGIVLESCRRVLEPEGYELLLAKSAEEALDALNADTFSLILLDLKMPVHDGIYLMKTLKDRGVDVPVVVMTGYSTVETMREADEMGASRFLPKPFTPDELIDTVRRVLKKERINETDQSTGDR